MNTKTYNVLFLCTGNSARSILAEVALNHRGAGKFKAYSAGSFPTGKVNPLAIELLQQEGFDTSNARSKSWDEFAGADAPQFDFIITVCDNAANEVCPIWPGKPLSAHWGVPDPAAVEGDIEKKRRAFREAFIVLAWRIDLLVSLPLEKLDAMAQEQKVRAIGKQ